MKIGIMSDSHDHRLNIRKALAIFEKKEVETIIHAGDLVSPFCVKMFEEYKGKFYLCSGNNKGDTVVISRMMKEVGFFYPEIGEFILDEKKFALYHGTEELVLNSLIYSKDSYDYVITGHTHKKLLRKVGKTFVINPGEIYDLYDHPTVVVLDTKTRKVEFHSLD
ncbi:MAG: metallophosphoesterase [Candidatus Heimdallarchaeaceae archaeon]